MSESDISIGLLSVVGHLFVFSYIAAHVVADWPIIMEDIEINNLKTVLSFILPLGTDNLRWYL